MRDEESAVNQMFQRAAGKEPSADDALARIRPQIRRAHQRRAAVRGGAGLVGVVALGAILVRSGDASANHLRVAGTGTTADATTVAPPSLVASSSVAPTTATSVSPGGVVLPPPSPTVDVTPPAPTSARAIAPTTVAATAPTPLVTPSAAAPDPTSSMPVSTAVTVSSASTSASSTSSIPSTTSSSWTSSSSSTSSTLAASTASFSSPGGSIEISYTPTAMTLLEVTPASGFTVGATDVQPDEIQVEFKRAGEDGTGIHIRLVGGVPKQVQLDE
jgi:hypothetical protein